MGLQSALTTSLTGLQAAETTISVVGNNVANSNTVGFKASDTVFATQFLQTITIGSAPSTGSGGTNPQQIGLGVQVASITPDFSQGTIEISSNPLDVAIQGDGFIQVQGLQGETLFTRNGQLALNSLNELTTIGGQRVLGFGVNDDFELQTAQQVPLTIPVGAEQVAQATENATFSGTLNPAVDLGSTPSISESAVFVDGSLSRPGTTDQFNPLTALFVSDPPSEPTSISTAATTLADDGPGGATVNYRIAFRDSNNNSNSNTGALSPIFTFTGHTPTDPVILDGLPANITNGDFDQYVIYRQENGGSRFFEVGTVAAADPPPTFTDFVNETTLTDGTSDQLFDGEATNVEPGSFDYFVTYFNPTTQTETAPTALGSRSISTAGGSRIRLDLTELDNAADGFSQLRIYRNVSGTNSDFRLVAGGVGNELFSSAAVTPTTSYIDTTPSSSLPDDVLNFDGQPPNIGTRLLDLESRGGTTTSPTFAPVFPSTGTLTFNANVAGIGIEQQEFVVGADTTVTELAAFLQDALGISTSSSSPGEPFPGLGDGGSVEFNQTTGQFVVTSNLGEQNAIEIPLTAFNFTPDGSQVSQPLSAIQFTETTQANGPGTSTELTVFDSLGLPINVRVTTVLESQDGNSTTYRWFATSGDNEPAGGTSTVVGDGLLTFDSNGELLPGSSDQIAVQRNDTASASPLAINLDFSGVTSLGQTNAQGELISSLNFTSQDGFPPGVLTDFIITDDGTIQGQFSNGVQRPLGQIVLARFANNQGLQAVGDNLYTQSVNSGPAITDVPGENGLGTLSAGAVELSNTDVGQNLIELILASTQYRSGARVITATQELLDELLALT